MTDQPNRTAFNADDETWWEDDPRLPAKGIMTGLCISIALWAVIIGALGSWLGWWS